jgi:hypothetical protein
MVALSTFFPFNLDSSASVITSTGYTACPKKIVPFLFIFF